MDPFTLGWVGSANWVLCRYRAQISWVAFHPITDPNFFQGHKNVLWQHRKTISHPAPPMRWKQSLVGSCCLLTLALDEMILIGQKWACFSDCSFSSLMALWDFLFIDKGKAASPVSVQRNCYRFVWATLYWSWNKHCYLFLQLLSVGKQANWLSVQQLEGLSRKTQYSSSALWW